MRLKVDSPGLTLSNSGNSGNNDSKRRGKMLSQPSFLKQCFYRETHPQLLSLSTVQK